MTTVLSSKQFAHDVMDHIHKMRDDDIRFKIGRTGGGTVSMSQFNFPLRFLQNLTWREHAGLIGQLPDKWLKKSGSMDVRVVAFNEEGHKSVTQLFIRDIKEATTFPPDFVSYRDIEFPLSQLENEDNLKRHPEVQLMLDAYKARRQEMDLTNKWERTRAEVINFFNACPSINQAIKLQPAMRMYVPPAYLKKIEEKVVRTKREKQPDPAIPAIDAAALAAQAVEVSLARTIQGGA